MTDEPIVRPNAKTTLGRIEISCYGRDMIMLDHPLMAAPIPVGPDEPEKFWEEYDDQKRLDILLDGFDKRIDFDNSPLMEAHRVVEDINEQREKYNV